MSQPCPVRRRRPSPQRQTAPPHARTAPPARARRCAAPATRRPPCASCPRWPCHRRGRPARGRSTLPPAAATQPRERRRRACGCGPSSAKTTRARCPAQRRHRTGSSCPCRTNGVHRSGRRGRACPQSQRSQRARCGARGRGRREVQPWRTQGERWSRPAAARTGCTVAAASRAGAEAARTASTSPWDGSAGRRTSWHAPSTTRRAAAAEQPCGARQRTEKEDHAGRVREG